MVFRNKAGKIHPPPEQLLIFTLVIGRWLAPKRDEQNVSDFRPRLRH